MTAFKKDWLERVAWTLAEAGLGVLITDLADLKWAYAPLIVSALSALKGLVAKKVGSGESASLGGDAK